MDNAKLGFFSRLRIAVFKFEDYEQFLVEETKKALFYYLKIVLCFSIIMTIVICCVLKTDITKVIEKIDTDAPNFKISEGKLEINDVSEYELYLDEINFMIKMDENKEKIDIKDYMNSVELLSTKMVLTYMGSSQEISYNDINISKDIVIEYFKSNNWFLVLMLISIYVLLIIFGMYFITFMLDIIMLSLIGMAINLITKIPIKFNKVFIIAVYSMTLPIILYLLYSIANLLFKTTIEYFEVAYNAISYIYLITVLLIIKSNLIKNTQELRRVIEEEQKVKEELERQKQEEKEKQEEANRDKEKDKKRKKEEKDNGEVEAEPEA